jgi:hypothetical protein
LGSVSTRSLRKDARNPTPSHRHTDFKSNIYLKAKKAGGMKITFQTPPKNLDEKMIYNVLRDYKILNCEVLVRDENGTLKPTALGVYSRPQTPY